MKAMLLRSIPIAGWIYLAYGAVRAAKGHALRHPLARAACVDLCARLAQRGVEVVERRHPVGVAARGGGAMQVVGESARDGSCGEPELAHAGPFERRSGGRVVSVDSAVSTRRRATDCSPGSGSARKSSAAAATAETTLPTSALTGAVLGWSSGSRRTVPDGSRRSLWARPGAVPGSGGWAAAGAPVSNAAHGESMGALRRRSLESGSERRSTYRRALAVWGSWRCDAPDVDCRPRRRKACSGGGAQPDRRTRPQVELQPSSRSRSSSANPARVPPASVLPAGGSPRYSQAMPSPSRSSLRL